MTLQDFIIFEGQRESLQFRQNSSGLLAQQRKKQTTGGGKKLYLFKNWAKEIVSQMHTEILTYA